MDYLAQLNMVADLSIENMKPNEFAVYMRMLFFNNTLHWKEWFAITYERLGSMAGISNRDTIATAINNLEQNGYIEVQRLGKRQGNRYRIIPLYCTDFSNNFGLKAVQSPDKTQTKAVQKPDKSRTKPPPLIRREETRDKETAAAAASDEHAISEVMTAFSNNIHPVTGEIERDALLDFCTSYGCNWTLAAIKEAAVNNGRSVRYIDAILRRWQAQGFPSTKSATAQPQVKSAYDPKKPAGPDNRPPDIPKNWVWNGCGWEEPFVE